VASETVSITILGATGSIGMSTLDVVSRHPDRYQVHALTANTNWERLLEQCLSFKPKFAVLNQPGSAAKLSNGLAESGSNTTVLTGTDGLCSVAASDDVDIVMAAIVGGAGLEPTLAAVQAGKKMLLANKESLVMSGKLFMDAVEEHKVTLLPIDSEHNAIYQCLANGAEAHAGGVRKILLTGSGGPFLRKPVKELDAVTPDEACAHPNWQMGRKISVDSASMMNKGLELIEACLLFSISPDDIQIVIHPQSIVHSMVEYLDGSTVAQLGNPDMRTPIAHGLAWPERIDSGVAGLDFADLVDLHFEEVDLERYPCLHLCQQVASSSQGHAIALNAANEIAVQYFLDELISFTEIPIIIESVLEQTSSQEVLTIDAVLAVDERSRVLAAEKIKRIGMRKRSS
jgi:1-deoxy-D-xylulose-5-phosphate reductoisomerase